MENQTKKPPFKSISIDLIEYNDIVNPTTLLSSIILDDILNYLNQGVKVFLTFEDRIIKEITKEDF